TSTPTGTYSITVTGTSGTLSHSAIYTLAVTAPVTGDFSISASPSSLTMNRFGSVSTTITITSLGGFSGTVTLSTGALPAGLTASFNTTSVTVASGGTGTSTLTFNGHGGGTAAATFTLAGSKRTIRFLAILKTPPPRIFRSNGSLDRYTSTTCPLRNLPGGFTSMLRTCPILTSNCLRPPSACSIVNNFRRKLLLLTKRKMMNPAIARRITRATVAGTAGRIMPIAPTRKCALKLNCPPPLFTIILSVVTYTVDPLGSPPARKYPITLSFGDVNTGPRLG